MSRLIAVLFTIVVAAALAGCGNERPPVDPEKAKISHKYRGGGKQKSESAPGDEKSTESPAESE